MNECEMDVKYYLVMNSLDWTVHYPFFFARYSDGETPMIFQISPFKVKEPSMVWIATIPKEKKVFGDRTVSG
jgi:hypothetical protein